jgi:Holliday junction resolvasome RuvABC ATP-dependent DNA helicase subunit
LPPQSLADFLSHWQSEKELWPSIDLAKTRGQPLGHTLLCGSQGSGKATLARLIADEMGVRMAAERGDAIGTPRDLANVVANLGQCGILFVDDIHHLTTDVENALCELMDDQQVHVLINYGGARKSVHLQLPQITILGATDQPEYLSPRLIRRFQHTYDFAVCDYCDVLHLIKRRSIVLGMEADEKALGEMARHASRQAQHLVDWTRDYARLWGYDAVTAEVAREVLDTLQPHPSLSEGPVDAPTPIRLRSRLYPLTWEEFEDQVARLFDALGYQHVRLTPRAADGGKDIIMEWADPLHGTRQLYVECKHWKVNSVVGQKAVQRLHAALLANPEVHEGVLVTTGTFSEKAVAYASQVGTILLVDRWKLEELIAQAEMRKR